MPSEIGDSQVAGPSPRGSDLPAGRLKSFSSVFAQLILILAVVYFWEIEERRQFFALMCIAVGGFLVHAWLPLRLRLAFFALLSMLRMEKVALSSKCPSKDTRE